MTAGARPASGKTEMEAMESVSRKGFWIGHGKRAFDVAKRMQARAAIPGATYTFEGFNGNGRKVQWDHPKFVPAYEVLIQVPRADQA